MEQLKACRRARKMPIIPMPIFIPDDGNEKLIMPDAVAVILLG